MTFRSTQTRVAVEMPPRARRTLTFVKNKLQTIQSDISKYTSRRGPSALSYTSSMENDESTQHRRSDFARLARHLCGKSIGLVLGGGGARGISQVGVIRALEEAGIPIDLVGGTSIGAFNAGLYAKDADSVPIYGRAKKFAGRMASLWRLATDLTWPTTSYTTGHEFNRGIWKTFGDTQIEDFWLSYYCNSANILKFRMEVHTTGYAWRYIRASMTLAGFLPPMTDEEGNMLVDGGYMDNLTVLDQCCRTNDRSPR
jgi:lysophospholipid hydrolase